MEEKTAQQPTTTPTIPTPQEVVKEAKKGNFNKSVILVAVLVILTAVLLVVSLNMKKGSPASVTNNAQQNVAKTNLTISDQPRASATSGTYETDVNIDSGGNKVTGVQLSLSFDPKALTNVDIKPGTFLPGATVISKQVDSEKGRITFLLGTAQGQKGVEGSGQIAVISFNKVSPDDTQINFLPDSLVSAEGYDQSVLSKTESAIIGPLPAQ